MKHTFDEQEFEIILGSDIVDDGMYLEAHDASDKVVLFASFYDKTRRFTFSTYGDELPLELVETFVARARQQLPSTEQD